MSETYAGRATARLGHTIVVKAEQRVPPQVAMPRAVAWAIVVTFVAAAAAVILAPFVDPHYRAMIGMTAAVALIAFFALVGTVKSMRGKR